MARTHITARPQSAAQTRQMAHTHLMGHTHSLAHTQPVAHIHPVGHTHLGAHTYVVGHTHHIAQTQPMAQPQTTAQTQPQTRQRLLREDINHAKTMARQLADHHWGTGSLWQHPANQLGLLNYDLDSVDTVAKLYVQEIHPDFPQPGLRLRGVWDEFVEAYLDASYVILSHKMGTQANMEETVDFVDSDRSGIAVTLEELPEYYIDQVVIRQREDWEERARWLQNQWAAAVRFGDDLDPEIRRWFINRNAEMAWTHPMAV